MDSEAYFSFIPMDIHANFEEIFLPATDDGVVGPIEVPGGLPFGDTVQTNIYVRSMLLCIYLVCDYYFIIDWNKWTYIFG